MLHSPRAFCVTDRDTGADNVKSEKFRACRQVTFTINSKNSCDIRCNVKVCKVKYAEAHCGAKHISRNSTYVHATS